jgi:nucleoside-diphosphate-sugar epimerase
VKRVLVTGATGFIGRHALAPLVERGYEVHALSSRGPLADEPNRDSNGDVPSEVVWHKCDLLVPEDRDAVVREVESTHLLHFAWYAEPGRYWTSTENLRWVEASLQLLRGVAAGGGQRVVMAGTCAEYDWDYGFFSEQTTPLRPMRLYGRSKHAVQEVGASFAEELGISFAWGRIFFLYGPREPSGRLVSSVAEGLLAGRQVPTSEGSQVRDFMHVEDVAEAFCALLDSDVQHPVNIASGIPVSVREVVAAVAEATGRPELVRWGAQPLREGEPPLIVGDARRLHTEVGFAPRYDLEAGARQTVEWWRRRVGRER